MGDKYLEPGLDDWTPHGDSYDDDDNDLDIQDPTEGMSFDEVAKEVREGRQRR